MNDEEAWNAAKTAVAEPTVFLFLVVLQIAIRSSYFESFYYCEIKRELRSVSSSIERYLAKAEIDEVKVLIQKELESGIAITVIDENQSTQYAIQYSPKGSDVFVHIQHSDVCCVFTIENAGAPISEVEHEKIWEPFYKMKETKSSMQNGTDLGLYIIKTIFELFRYHYGVINTPSSVCFYFYAPLDSAWVERE